MLSERRRAFVDGEAGLYHRLGRVFCCAGLPQESGDVIYVPRFYGHSVINFDQSIAVAYEFDRGAEC